MPLRHLNFDLPTLAWQTLVRRAAAGGTLAHRDRTKHRSIAQKVINALASP